MLKGTFGRLIGGGGSGNDTPINVDTPSGRLQAFLREVDNTTLCRRLTLMIGDRELSFDVANKQVLKLIEAKPDPDGRAQQAAEIVRDYDALDGQLKLLAEILTAYISRAGEFDIVSRQSPVTYPPKMDGFPTAEWRFACDLYGTIPAEFVSDEPIAEDVAAVAPAAAAPAPTPAVPQPAVAAPAPAPVAREPVLASAAVLAKIVAAPTERETLAAVATAISPAPAVAEPVAPPSNDPVIVENFYEAVSRHCDLSMLITEHGDVVQFSDSAAGWFDIGPDIAKDMKHWVMETAKIMPGCQLVVMRSPILQNQSVIFMTNGALTAFGAFSSHVTGRIFSIANEYVGMRR